MAKKMRTNKFEPTALERAMQGRGIDTSPVRTARLMQTHGFDSAHFGIDANISNGHFVKRFVPEGAVPAGNGTCPNPLNEDPKVCLPKEAHKGTILNVQWPKDGKTYYRDFATFKYVSEDVGWKMLPDPKRTWYTGKGGACYRTCCKKENSAEFYNSGTNEYYCGHCALEIQRANLGQSFVLFEEHHKALNREEGALTLRELRLRSKERGFDIY